MLKSVVLTGALLASVAAARAGPIMDHYVGDYCATQENGEIHLQSKEWVKGPCQGFAISRSGYRTLDVSCTFRSIRRTGNLWAPVTHSLPEERVPELALVIDCPEQSPVRARMRILRVDILIQPLYGVPYLPTMPPADPPGYRREYK
jgi:hypothetical protein